MADYDSWNKEIYNYFFNSENEKEVLFCVDNIVIENIGKNSFNIDIPAAAFKDFCSAVSEKIVDKKRNQIRFSFNEMNTLKENIPFQTSILATFVLAASSMKRDEHYSLKAYYPHLYSLLTGNHETEYDEKFTKWLCKNNKNIIKPLWRNFEEFINNNSNHSINFNIVDYDNEERERYIDIPILQSLISQQDKQDLMTFFEEYNNNTFNSNFDEELFKSAFLNFFKRHKFSSRLKYYVEKNQKQLFQKIIHLYKNWDGFVYYKNETENCYKKGKSLKLGIQYSYDNFEFALFSKNNQLNDYEYDYFEEIDISDLKPDSTLNYEEKHIHKVKDHYLFGIDSNMDGFNLEMPKVAIGEEFHILYSTSLSESIESELKEIVGFFDISKKQQIGNYYLLKRLKANFLAHNTSIIEIDSHIRIELSKGLKLQGNQYLSSAPPDVKIYGNPKKVFLNDEEINYQNKISGLENFKTIGLYTLKADNASKQFILSDYIDDNTDFNPIYNIFSSDTISDKKLEIEGKHPAITGCRILNLDEVSTDLKVVLQLTKEQKSKIIYILGLINAKGPLFTEQNVYIAEFNRTLDIIENTLKHINDRMIYNLFKQAFNSNRKISQLEYIYLLEIGKILDLRVGKL